MLYKKEYRMKKLAILLAGGLMVSAAAQAHEVLHHGHNHAHGVDCGHAAIAHDGHVDYLHDGHMHSGHDGHADEHAIAISTANPASEDLIAQVDHTPHKHGGDDDVHMRVQHGDHVDFIHDGELHFDHDGHVDSHGKVTLIPS
jgi:hypothetical protein